MDFEEYAKGKAEGRDVVRFEVIHARMTGDAVSGLLLSQLVYWHGVDRHGQPRRKVQREGRSWVAKANNEWKAETWLSEDQAKRAVSKLKDLGLVDVQVWKFAGRPVTHLSINEGAFMARLAEARKEAEQEAQEQPEMTDDVVSQPESIRGVRRVDSGSTPSPLTQTTTETTDDDDQYPLSISSKNIRTPKDSEYLEPLEIKGLTLRRMGFSGSTFNKLMCIDIDAAFCQSWLRWLEAGDLTRFNNPAGFAYSQMCDGNPPPRQGMKPNEVVRLGEVEDYRSGIVHTRTNDRFQNMLDARANRAAQAAEVAP